MNRSTRTLLLSSVFASLIFGIFSLVYKPSPGQSSPFVQMPLVQKELEKVIQEHYGVYDYFYYDREKLSNTAHDWILLNALKYPEISENGDITWLLRRKRDGEPIVIEYRSIFNPKGGLKGWYCQSPNWPEIQHFIPACSFNPR